MTRASRQIIVVVLAGVAVFAGFSIYADVSELSERLAGFSWWAFGAACGLAMTNYAVRFARWSAYLASRNISVPAAISVLTFLSGFALSITPGKLGELIKSYLLRASHGVAMTRSAPVVVAERVTDLLALLVLALAGVALYGMARSLVITGAVIISAGLFVLAWPPAAHGAINLIARLGPLVRIGAKVRLFYDGLAELVRPRPLAWGTGLGVIAWLAECIGFAVILAAFPGTDVPIELAMLIYAATTMAGALSFLPGGLLVTEATMTLFLVQSSRGVDQPTAVAATILTRLATLWFAVVLGLIALAILRRVAPAAQRALDETSTQAPP
ncbi:MAG: flippase-like domain-containing protein [Proteobacteria bacterium]|nr:flippase-like domain-containing protein [Pseudomonadota bacterium]